jgi:hypothetical protein
MISDWLASPATAAHRGPANVPPTMEIEILDPNADPLGRPAVELNRDEYGNLIVDIPPVVLVHRYYYTGDRSFQAQLLPGGPSIVVVNHPKTGERCYIDVQMMPGAPRVTYTGHSIEYDYGEHGITVHFGLFGRPSVKYRSGQTWGRKLGKLVHAEHWQDGAAEAYKKTSTVAKYSKTMAKGAIAETCDATEQVLLPVKNVVHMMPFGKTLFATDWTDRLVTSAAEHEREKDIHYYEHEAKLREITIPSVRGSRVP